MKRASIAVVAVAAGLALGVPSAEAELRVGENYRLNSTDPSDVRGKDAVGLAVNPRNPENVVSINADWLFGECEYSASFDGGDTWASAAPMPLPPGFSPESCKVGGHLGHAIDRGVAFGSADNVYATFAAPPVNDGVEGTDAILVAKSTNGGKTFDTVVVAIQGGTYGLPKLAVDPATAGGPSADRVYLVAEHSRLGSRNTAVSVSDDGGETFSTPVNANAVGENAVEQSQPVVTRDGAVLVAWRQLGPVGDVVVARSVDQGQTWTRTQAATVRSHGANVQSTFPRLATDQASGNVYLVYGQGPPGPSPPPGGFAAADHFIHPDIDVYFQRSTNGGAKFSAPLQINDSTPRPGSEVTQTRHPEVSVAPNGRVDVVWEDRRHWYRGCTDTHSRCEEARLGDIYHANSTTGGASFSRDRRITDRSHNNDVGFDYRFGTYWDFGPVAVPLGNDELLVGWMDSRRGNYENDTQDSFLAKVNFQGPSAVPQESLNRPDDTALSVAFSNIAYPGGGEALLASTFATRGATRVVIVNERDVPGALAGGVLARAALGPVLLSPRSGLPANVKEEVARLDPVGAYVIGGEGSLSAEVVKDPAAAGVPSDQIDRVAAPGDAATAAGVANRLDRRSDAEKDSGAPAFHAAVIANPDSPDAGAASGLAAARRLPVLYVGRNSVPPATKDALTSLAIEKTLVIGGAETVSDAVVAQLPGPQRLGGANQYESSAAVVAESRARGVPENIAYVANGGAPMDVALAGAALGRVGGLLVLSEGPLTASSADTLARLGLSARLDRAILIQPSGPASKVEVRCSARVANVIRGTASRNMIRGTRKVDRVFAGAGNDKVTAGAGDDCVDLGSGLDRGLGQRGHDLVRGGRGKDHLQGGGGNDRLLGGSRRDRLVGGPGKDRVRGDRGNDRLNGGSGRDRLLGGSGDDRLFGGSLSDRLRGGPGKDRLSGGSGKDRIISRDRRRDRISCGRGRDTVIADHRDRVASDCERVRKRRAKRGRSS